MVKQADCEFSHLTYLTEVAKGYKCAVGIILGQATTGKYNVIHFARTPIFQSDEDKNAEKSPKVMKDIAEANDSWIAEHAQQTARMLPGGMHILGIFIISDEELLSPLNAKLKSILSVIEKQLQTKKYLFGSGDNEKLILQYSAKTQKYSGKSYDLKTFNVQPVEFKFLQKVNKWVNLECTYQVDRTYFIKRKENDGPLREHIKEILDKINKSLLCGKILFDYNLKQPEEALESIGKKKTAPSRSKGGAKYTQAEVQDKNVQVIIFEPCENENENDSIETTNVGGQIRIVGEVTSRLCLSVKSTIEEASKAVTSDIMKSLATRLEMHWDSLTEEELSEDVNSVHEPPRRVLIKLPESSVTISDYLFPGEGPDDAKAALEELLDIQADSIPEILDLEPQADITQYYKATEPAESEENLTRMTKTEKNKFIYVVGIGAALIVLLIAVIIQFLSQ